MTLRLRSPFGTILREERRSAGLSQTELANKIAERFASDPSVAAYGVISDRAIANIEAAKDSPADFVRPRQESVHVIMLALNIDPQSERGQAMLRAAAQTHRRAPSTRPSTGDTYNIPFVKGGREAQWASLMASWEMVLTGQPRIHFIEGTAGVGKTRLVEEFCTVLESDTQPIILAMGECSSGAASNEPYLPWRRALSHVLRRDMKFADPNPNTFIYADALLASVHKLGGVIIDLQDLEEWFLVRAPESISGFNRMRDTLSPTNTTGRYDQLMALIAAVTRDRPLVIVLEDLHWADESSCSLLLHLQRQMRLHTDMPVLVIGTFRSSDLVVAQGRHPLHHVINEMSRQIDSVVISLESAVGAQSGQHFVSELVSAFPMSAEDHATLTSLLFGRTYGHPLFTTEMLRRLVETKGLVQQPNGTWSLDSAQMAVELPRKMRAIIDERLQRLSDPARTIVEAASVQGGPFSPEDLPMITGLSSSDISILLDRELVEGHRIFRYASDQMDGEYEFSHQVMAETVYESLSPNRLRALHRATAEAVVERFKNHPLQGAPHATHHYEMAGMYAEAAEQALLTSYATLAKLDHDLTFVWVDQSERLALLANDTRKLWDARLRRAHVLRSIGTLQEARTIGHDAMIQSQRMGDISLEAEATEILALVAYDRGSLDEATDLWNRAIMLFEKIDRRDRMRASHAMLSHVACRLGRLDAAIRHAQASWAAAPDPQQDGLGAEALLAEGNALLELGRYGDAVDVFRRSLATYSYTGEMRGILLSRMNIGMANTRLGNLEAARAEFDALLEEMEPLHTPRLVAFVCFYKGVALEQSGEYAEAMEWFKRAFQTRQESGLDAMIGDDLGGILRCAVQLDSDVEYHLNQLQQWWRTNDPRALEDPLNALMALVVAYEKLGNDRLMRMTLAEGANMHLQRAEQIEHPHIRTTYLRGNATGVLLLERAKEAGLIQN